MTSMHRYKYTLPAFTLAMSVALASPVVSPRPTATALHAIAKAFYLQDGVAHHVCLSIDGTQPAAEQLVRTRLPAGKRLLGVERCRWSGDYYVEKDSSLAAVHVELTRIVFRDAEMSASVVWTRNRWESCSETLTLQKVEKGWKVTRGETYRCTVE